MCKQCGIMLGESLQIVRCNNVILDDLFVWLNKVEISFMCWDQELILSDKQVIVDLFKNYKVRIIILG